MARPPGRGSALTERERTAIAEQWRQGRRVSQICREFDVTESTVYRVARALGAVREVLVPRRRWRPVKRMGWTLSVADRRYLIRCWERGYSVADICRALEVTGPTVRKWLRQWEAEGAAGLQDKPRPSPERPPHQTPDTVAQAIRAMAAEEPGLPVSELARRATRLRYPDGQHKMRWQTVRKILNG
jgi:transposase-like protein